MKKTKISISPDYAKRRGYSKLAHDDRLIRVVLTGRQLIDAYKHIFNFRLLCRDQRTKATATMICDRFKESICLSAVIITTPNKKYDKPAEWLPSPQLDRRNSIPIFAVLPGVSRIYLRQDDLSKIIKMFDYLERVNKSEVFADDSSMRILRDAAYDSKIM